MFGRKDSMREFEQMRQALKPNERRNGNAEEPTDASAESQITSQENAPMSNITVMPASSVQVRKVGSTSAEEYSSIVSTGSIWQGNLKIEGSVRIDGQLSGEVEARGTVLVSEGADVDAKVRAAFVIVAGSFHGQVECGERLEIMPTGRVNGELTTKSLVVHEGAFVEGQIRMSSGAVPAARSAPSNGKARAVAEETGTVASASPAASATAN